MRNVVLFQMCIPFRRSLIRGHQFYIAQARKRLLSQFENMEVEAEKESQDWLEQSSQRFDPDRHDPASFYEQANEVGIEFYSLLSDMKDQTYLSVVAGMFHEWDKQLRDWLVREMRHWHRGAQAKLKVWKVNFTEITDFLECIGWKLKGTDHLKALDACRLVVNVHKHGDGDSLKNLRTKYPEYLPDPLNGMGASFFKAIERDHTHLKVTDQQLTSFSDAIIAFWKAAPENVKEAEVTELPSWFETAILKDQTEQAQKNK